MTALRKETDTVAVSDTAPAVWKCRGREIDVHGRPVLMGILNTTPDSFSDGGKFLDVEAAVQHGEHMLESGADILDIGGESSRPGAAPVPEDEEIRRVIPVVRELSERHDAIISIDTAKAGVAESAIDAGACIVNDISAMKNEARMKDVVREHAVGVILMHMQGSPRTMQTSPHYGDVVEDILSWLETVVAKAVDDGIDPAAIAIDPGIGFGKTPEHNIRLMANIARFLEPGHPLVVGVSRKSVLGKITGAPVHERLAAGLAAAAWCMAQGVHVLRVHDVKETADAAKVVSAFKRESSDV